MRMHDSVSAQNVLWVFARISCPRVFSLLYVCLSVVLFVRLPVCLMPVCLSVCQSVQLLDCLSSIRVCSSVQFPSRPFTLAVQYSWRPLPQFQSCGCKELQTVFEQQNQLKACSDTTASFSSWAVNTFSYRRAGLKRWRHRSLFQLKICCKLCSWKNEMQLYLLKNWFCRDEAASRFCYYCRYCKM